MRKAVDLFDDELLKNEYSNYIRDIGLRKSCHIPREQSELLSLLTELATGKRDLFPGNDITHVGFRGPENELLKRN